MRYRPSKDRLIVRQDAGQEKTEGGIYLPDTVVAQERPNFGTVLESGAETYRVGQRIAYSRYAGSVLPDPDEPRGSPKAVLVLNVEDVLVVVAEE